MSTGTDKLKTAIGIIQAALDMIEQDGADIQVAVLITTTDTEVHGVSHSCLLGKKDKMSPIDHIMSFLRESLRLLEDSCESSVLTSTEVQ